MRKWLWRVVLALVIGTVAVAVLVVIAWFAVLPGLAEDEVLAALENAGLGPADGQIESVAWRRVVLRDVSLGSHGELTVKRVTLAFDGPFVVAPDSLSAIRLEQPVWRTGVDAGGAMSLAPFDGLGGDDRDTGDNAMPFKRLEIVDGRVEATTPDGPLTATVAGQWAIHDGSPDALSLRLGLGDTAGTTPLNVNGQLVRPTGDGPTTVSLAVDGGPTRVDTPWASGDVSEVDARLSATAAAAGLTRLLITANLTADGVSSDIDGTAATFGGPIAFEARGDATHPFTVRRASAERVALALDRPLTAARIEATSTPALWAEQRLASLTVEGAAWSFELGSDNATEPQPEPTTAPAEVPLIPGLVLPKLPAAWPAERVLITGTATAIDGDRSIPIAVRATLEAESDHKAKLDITAHPSLGETAPIRLTGGVTLDGQGGGGADFRVDAETIDYENAELSARIGGLGGRASFAVRGGRVVDIDFKAGAKSASAKLAREDGLKLDAAGWASAWGEAATLSEFRPWLHPTITEGTLEYPDADLIAKGLYADVIIDRLDPLSTSPRQPLEASHVTVAGVPLGKVRMGVEITESGSVVIGYATTSSAAFGECRVTDRTLRPFSPPFELTLAFNDLNLDTLLGEFGQDKVAGSGTINGWVTLGVNIDPLDIQLLDGKATGVPGGRINVKASGELDEMLRESDPRFAQGGALADVRQGAVTSLEDFVFQKLAVAVEKGPGGKPRLAVDLAGNGRKAGSIPIGGLRLNLNGINDWLDFVLAASEAADG